MLCYIMNKDRIQILSIVSYKIYPANMGGQKGIAFFYEYLSALMPLHMISTKNNDDTNNLNITQHKLLGNGKFKYVNISLIFTLKKFIKKHGITHLIIEHPYYGWLAYILKKITGVKLIVHSHNIEALRFKSTGKWWWRILFSYEKFTHNIADHNFFIHDTDKQFAIDTYKLNANVCTTITYGFDMQQTIQAQAHEAAKKQLLTTYGLPNNTTLMLFNGTLNYAPNLLALDVILHNINTKLQQVIHTPYAIIICGKNLPAHYNGLKAFANTNIIYAGFVEDIGVYFKGCNIFLNPVIEGGGIKTKLVEALGYSMHVVTTNDGAIGIDRAICGNKLNIVENNWDVFSRKVISLVDAPFTPIPNNYFEHFYWGNIAAKAIQQLIHL
jgi:polysaccharide biosynthesis protein PslH